MFSIFICFFGIYFDGMNGDSCSEYESLDCVRSIVDMLWLAFGVLGKRTGESS